MPRAERCERGGTKRLRTAEKIEMKRCRLELGRAALRQLYRVSARQFSVARHQKNIVAGPAVHLLRQHGSDVLPQEVRKRFPDLGKSRA